MKNRIFGTALVSFIAAVAGIAISFLLLREDVISTAKTVAEYFPMRYGVTPSTTWEGAIILGLFTSVLQVVAASVVVSDKFSRNVRIVATVALLSSLSFDNWTDVVFRSGYGTGDMWVALISTMAFYTLGSEITQGLSWAIFFATWRLAIGDFMWGLARTVAGIGSITDEWHRYRDAAERKERGEQPKFHGPPPPAKSHQFPEGSLMHQRSAPPQDKPRVFNDNFLKKFKTGK